MLTLIAGLAAALPALGQDCMWANPGSTPGVYGPTVVYDTVLASVIAVDGIGTVSRWNGSTWTTLTSGGVPARWTPAVCFDSARGRVVLHGGYFPNIVPAGDTWEWDGSQWSQIPVSGPAATTSQRVLVFDTARGCSVLLHSSSGSGVNQTWTWNGAVWTQASFSGPVGRTAYSMTYDSTRQRVVLYGGVTRTSPFALLADVWEWDGASWLQRGNAPEAWQGHLMGYDPIRARIIVHGSAGQSAPVETFDYDPAADAWTLRATGGPPPEGRAIAFDSARQRGVIRGNTSPNTTWEWNVNGAVSPTVIVQQPTNVDVAPGLRAQFPVVAVSTGALTYQWYNGGIPLSNAAHISGANTATLEINPVSSADQGLYHVVIGNGCSAVQSRDARLYVLGSPCYANCDESSITPILNANDFQCFLNHYAARESYANCDGSLSNPMFTASDFQCFLNAFAQGCL